MKLKKIGLFEIIWDLSLALFFTLSTLKGMRDLYSPEYFAQTPIIKVLILIYVALSLIMFITYVVRIAAYSVINMIVKYSEEKEIE